MALIENLKSSRNFALSFVGDGPVSNPLMEYVKENNIENVSFAGRYRKQEEMGIVNNYDFISIYLLNGLNADTCMANRFYLSAVMRKPMIVNNGSYQADIAKKYGIGIILDDVHSFEDTISEYIRNFDSEHYECGCRRFLCDVEKELQGWRDSIKNFANT